MLTRREAAECMALGACAAVLLAFAKAILVAAICP